MPRRVLEGQVVSDKGDKTIVVNVQRRFKHPVYKKYVLSTKKYSAHDESNECGIGDTVAIEECAPISKTKRFKVIELKEKARVATAMIDDIDESHETVKRTDKEEATEEATSEEKK